MIHVGIAGTPRRGKPSGTSRTDWRRSPAIHQSRERRVKPRARRSATASRSAIPIPWHRIIVRTPSWDPMPLFRQQVHRIGRRRSGFRRCRKLGRVHSSPPSTRKRSTRHRRRTRSGIWAPRSLSWTSVESAARGRPLRPPSRQPPRRRPPAAGTRRVASEYGSAAFRGQVAELDFRTDPRSSARIRWRQSNRPHLRSRRCKGGYPGACPQARYLQS